MEVRRSGSAEAGVGGEPEGSSGRLPQQPATLPVPHPYGVGDPLEGVDLHELLERAPIPLEVVRARAGLEGRRLLITGAGGSIGSSLADLLLGFSPAELVLLDHHENSLFDLTQRMAILHPGKRVRYLLADVRDRAKLGRVFGVHRPEVVIHLAAYKHVHLGEENPDQAVSVNVLGALAVAQAAAAAGVERLVYSSTDKAVSPPSIYGATKRAVELLLLALRDHGAGTSFRIVRLVNTLGAQGGVIRTFARQIRSGQAVTITDEAMTRYWISMPEATGFLALMAGLADPEGLFILDLGAPIQLGRVARRLWDLLRPSEPFESKCVGVRPGERLHEPLTYPHEELEPSPYPGILRIQEKGSPRLGLPELLSGMAQIEGCLDQGNLAGLREGLFDLVRVRTAVASG